MSYFQWLCWLLSDFFAWLSEGLTKKMGFSIPVTSDVGAVAEALAEWAKLGGDVLAVWDSPQMIQARETAAKAKLVAQMDADLAAANKTGDFTKVDRDSSG